MPEAVATLEREFAAWLGAAGAVAAGFGRSALRLALEAVQVRGAEVLVPDFICTQVPEAVRRAGGRPVFFPVRRDLAVDVGGFERAFTAQTRAVIVAHYFGRLQPHMTRLACICRERKIPLVEDCALALGASAEGRPGGAEANLAVFSFTKSDWCYGGGIVASRSAELVAKMCSVREKLFQPCAALLFLYGLLRRADFAANRPSRSRVAAGMGRWLERASGLREANFYDAGRFDATVSEFAARRALRLLADLPKALARRREIQRHLVRKLADSSQTLLWREPAPSDAASFLPIVCEAGDAEDWIARAGQDRVTLRRCWLAYQTIEGLPASSDLEWLAEHLLLLELHPRLTPREVVQIAQTLKRLPRRRD